LYGKLLTIWLFAFWPSFAHADELKLRAIDSHGKPLAGNVVHVTFSPGDGRVQRLELKTDASGEASFSVPAPLPTRISVAVVPKANQHWRCQWRGTCGTSLTPEEALRNGFAYYESQKKAERKTNPGEILFVARGRTFWQHLLAPIAE
jgi:hypothetical protein